MGETSTLDDDLDDIRKVAAKRPSLDGNGIVGTPKRVETMVREAGDAFDLGSEAALTAWKFCSGITHKRVWASINLLDREQLSHVANVGNYHVTASFKNVFAVTAISVVFSKDPTWAKLVRTLVDGGQCLADLVGQWVFGGHGVWLPVLILMVR
jgi:hypothetical protein